MAKTAIGSEPLVGSLVPSKKRDYRVTNKLQEGKRPLYAVAFNFIDSRYFNVFATFGGNRATVYQCLEGGVIAALQSYVDEDQSNYHKCLFLTTFSFFLSRTDCLRLDQDESVRLWNVHTGICILIFAGAGGHRNEVLSVDFHPSDIYRIASCGMDNTVKIWSMKEFWTYVEKSFTWTDLPSKFPTKYVQFPSVDNEIVLWEPKMKEQSPGEFSCDFHYNAAAIGNREGKIYVWELQSSPPVLIARLSHAQSKSPIRQTAMSFDGSTILSCCEDGAIWRWDAVSTS
ncbi:hypothetical protein Patl1_04329 [Pistacia atlantica]|uniref:Uncharacterized protein n=1 Tax=Pistacia atlantica TaxID=434234 RepID=A0ACC1BT32_9ROSI|nr:hypothetical protein Patl1_04329 [Pistacia atlantica]